jgi:hypothetical protein
MIREAVISLSESPRGASRGVSLGEGRDPARTGTATGFGAAEAADRALRKRIHFPFEEVQQR